jgi:hypothetical protein
MSKIEQLKQWIAACIPGEAWDKYILNIKKDEKLGDHIYCIRLFTKSCHHYQITAIEKDNGKDYLGCTMSTDYYLAGEEHTRGLDLPDGPFTKETWTKIMQSIIAHELRELGTR